MKVRDLIDKLDFKLIVGDLDREITGLYSCDLLSWVIANANAGDLWVTVMNNINIIAVASLTEVACIVLAEGVDLDEALIERARDKEVTILSSKDPSAKIIIRANEIL